MSFRELGEITIILALIGVDAYLPVYVRMRLNVLNNNIKFELFTIVSATIANLSCGGPGRGSGSAHFTMVYGVDVQI